jgi:cystathionine beta-lyase/cystathionine gamma-synthase
MDISYILNELGEERELYFNAVTPPLVQSTNFAFKTVAEMREKISREYEEAIYTRGVNPTIDILRKKMAALENTEDCLAFGSGSAAVAAAVMANIKAGEHIVCVHKPYSWTDKLLSQLLVRFGVETTFVDGTLAENFEKAIQPNTKIIYLESPNSFTFELQDLEVVSAIAKKHGLLTIIDNSYASPLPEYQQPSRFGIDIIIHSASKYICGHSDAVAGVLCCSHEMMKKIFKSEFMTLGGVISPFNAWLLVRGLRTLPIRMAKVTETTLEVVNFLENHPKVEKVYYPFSASHPQYELAKKQMRKGGGQFSIALKTNELAAIELFCDSLKRFLMAVSWGGYESLIFPACTAYRATTAYSEIPINVIRFYIGLEEPKILIEDLAQALETPPPAPPR